MDIEIGKGAVVVGNEELPSVLVLDWQSADGTFRLCKSRSQYDRYKSFVQLAFKKPKLQLRTNVDFKENKATFTRHRKPSRWVRLQHKIRQLLFKNTPPLSATLQQPSPTNTHGKWRGLSRYQVENMNAARRALLFEEYGKVTTIVDSSQMELVYYADEAGLVPEQVIQRLFLDDDPYVCANGDLSPQWGIELKFKSSIVHYGPWADRQRFVAINVFGFKGLFVDRQYNLTFIRMRIERFRRQRFQNLANLVYIRCSISELTLTMTSLGAYLHESPPRFL